MVGVLLWLGSFIVDESLSETMDGVTSDKLSPSSYSEAFLDTSRFNALISASQDQRRLRAAGLVVSTRSNPDVRTGSAALTNSSLATHVTGLRVGGNPLAGGELSGP